MKKSMFKKIVLHGAAWFALSAMFSGCSCTVRTYNVSKPDPVVVKTAPPEAKEETKPEKPGEKHVWKAGAWEWNEDLDKWEWEVGTWAVPPSGYVWQSATYEAQGDDAVLYTPGHWVEGGKTELKSTGNQRGEESTQESEPASEETGAETDEKAQYKESQPTRKGDRGSAGTVE